MGGKNRKFKNFLRKTILNFTSTAALATAQPQYLALESEPKVTITSSAGEVATFGSILEAMDNVSEGDVVLLSSGVHRGPWKFKANGVTLRGEPGAILNGNAAWEPQWETASAYGKHAYKAPIEFNPAAMSRNGRMLINAVEGRGGASVHHHGIGRGGRTSLQGIYTYLASEKKVLVSFPDPWQDFENDIQVAIPGVATVDIQSVSDCNVEGLIIVGGSTGVRFKNAKSCKLKNSLVIGSNSCVSLLEGASECKVMHNDITWNPDALSFDVNLHTGMLDNDIWQAHKRFGTYDKWGVRVLRSGSNNQVAYNYIYNNWNGIQVENGIGKSEIADHYKNTVLAGKKVTFNRGLRIHHNRVDLTIDDALEPTAELINNWWYSNVVTRAKCSARFKTISMGPFYFFDNTLLQSQDGIRLYKSTPEQANVYIYNNYSESASGLSYHKVGDVSWGDKWIRANMKRGTPGFHIFNNVFICMSTFSNGDGVTPNFIGDNNLYLSSRDTTIQSSDIDVHSYFDQTPAFVNQSLGDFRLIEDDACAYSPYDMKTLLNAPFGNIDLDGINPSRLGLLGIERSATPTGSQTGLWEFAERYLSLGEKSAAGLIMEPLRWFKSKSQTYWITNTTLQSKDIELRLMRARSKPGNFKIRVVDETENKELYNERFKASQDIFMSEIPVSIAGGSRLRVDIDDDLNGLWCWVEMPENCSMEVPSKTLYQLEKYDGGIYEFVYTPKVSETNFTIAFSPHYDPEFGDVTVIGPSRQRYHDKRELQVPVKEYGPYTIQLRFTKRADFYIMGENPYLSLPSDQPVRAVELRWGKPNF